MGVSDIYSKRQKRESGEIDVYQYDEIPEALRVQIVYILTDLIGIPNAGGPAGDVYASIVRALAREYGKKQLASGRIAAEQLFNFIDEIAEAPQVLDAIEVSFDYVQSANIQNLDYRYNNVLGVKMSVTEGIKELNFRFQEAAVGYQYESGRMIRIDSQFVHEEIVKPALVLLSDPRYAGAEEEFLNAHKHYREGNYKECLTDCLKAFESTMKTIYEIRKWSYKKTDTAKPLIDICFKKGLIPPMLQAQIGALQSVIESGVPTLRNRMGAHGQGAVPTAVPPYVAAYALHLTAANIVLLVNAEKG
jgi:AbiJ N-terminal domain 4